MKEIVVALAGNPNAGKTTVFNALTGSRQHVGNYPGVTVEKKEGTAKLGEQKFTIVDLPGTYSLSASSPEEVVSRDYLVNDKPDVVVHVLDASNIERNLYLATQLIELGANLVFALNMADVAKSQGVEFDLKKMSELLNAPIIPTVGSKGTGLEKLLQTVIDVTNKPKEKREIKISYPAEIENAIKQVNDLLVSENIKSQHGYTSMWMAARLIENDKAVTARVKSEKVAKIVKENREKIEKIIGCSPEIAMAESRYGWISGLSAEAIKSTVISRHDLSDKVDTILLNRVLGLPIFFLMMFIVFQLVFTIGDPIKDIIESGFATLGSKVLHLWPKSAESPLRDLLANGIIGGVGAVISFLPNIILLFLAISFLEGTGYMSRAAFLMDKIMHKIGLHGKSFIPMLIGFGCTVPGIMGTRTLDNRSDRLATILVLPFMSCSARLPIYALIIPIFFGGNIRGWMMLLMYMIGIVFAIIGAKLLRSTMLKGETVPFVMELPPYRLPTFASVMIQMWEKAHGYIKKAGTIILGISIVLWALSAYPKNTKIDEGFTKQTETAQVKVIAETQQFAEKQLKLGAKSNVLATWTALNIEKEEKLSQYWSTEPEYAKIEKEYDGKIENILALGKNDQKIDNFVAINAIYQDFEESIAGEDEESTEIAKAKDIFTKNILSLKKESTMPELIDELVDKVNFYRSKILLEYKETIEEINSEEDAGTLAYSYAGRFGKTFEPILKPIGFDWRIGTALFGAFAAKEVFVAQLGIVYSVGADTDENSTSLQDKIRKYYSPLQGLCMMIFCLLSAPCVATIAITKREAGGWSHALGMLIGMTLVAYVTTLIVYQVGTMLGF